MKLGKMANIQLADIRVIESQDEAALRDFLSRNLDQAFLAQSNLVRGGLIDRGEAYQGRYAARFENGSITAMAARYWNGMVMIIGQSPLAELVNVAAGEGAVRGVMGPLPMVQEAVAALQAKGLTVARDMPHDHLALELKDLVLPDQLKDRAIQCRRPRVSEIDLLANWRAEQDIEVFGSADSDDLRRGARDFVEAACRERMMWVLEDKGRLVANCNFVGLTESHVQIGNVRTLPAHRGKGYARAVVAGALLRARHKGVKRALLITDSAAAKRAYEAVGFHRLGDFGLVFLEARHELVA